MKIGSTVEARFLSFGEQFIAKVDTGADLSSIDATNIKSSDNMVSFSSPRISKNTIRVKIERTQPVRNSDGSTEDREVINLSIVINGKTIRSDFTLNDRSKNQFPVLIGKNTLEIAGFTVDVSESLETINNQEDIVDAASGPQNVVKQGEPPVDHVREVFDMMRRYKVKLSKLVEMIEEFDENSDKKEDKEIKNSLKSELKLDNEDESPDDEITDTEEDKMEKSEKMNAMKKRKKEYQESQ